MRAARQLTVALVALAAGAALLAPAAAGPAGPIIRPVFTSDTRSASRGAARAGARAFSTEAATVCPDVIGYGINGQPLNYPDWPKGRESEADDLSYMQLTQADQVRAVGNTTLVMFCIIDSGIGELRDLSNRTTGCVPGTKRDPRDARPRACFPWDEDTQFTGTAHASVIGALKNGRGMVGIQPGAQIYSYNVRGSRDVPIDAPAFLDAVSDCLREHDLRKKARRGLRMVVLTDFGSSYASMSGNLGMAARAIKNWAAHRPDVMFIGSASRVTFGNGTVADSYPGRFPEFLAVAATTANGSWSEVLSFATNWTSVSAPGEWIMSELPRNPPQDIYPSMYLAGSLAVPAVTTDNPSFFTIPAPAPILESAVGSVTAEVVDCGLGSGTCAGAAGKICLLQRGGGISSATKVANCMAGGGVAALLYMSDNLPECERLFVKLRAPVSPSGAPWPVMLTISLLQGRAVKAALAVGGLVTATVGYAGPPDFDLTAQDYLPSAAAVVAGVVGLLWSGHPSCSATQMRQALEATARQVEGAQGTRNDKFGYGIVQAKAADDYLLANPCTLFNPELAVSAPRPTGPTVVVTVQLMFPPTVTFHPPIFTVANKPIIVTSTPTDTIDCGNQTVTTDATGTAYATCQVLRSGPATVTATAPPSFGFNAVTRSIRFF